MMKRLLWLLVLNSVALKEAAGGDVCVSGHDSGPVFEEQPSSLIYPEGLIEGKVTLSCQARASPAASYRWLVNGTEVPLGLDLRYTLVAGNLVISSPESIRDTGSYQCLAINRCGTIISRAANLKFGYLNDFPPDSRSPQTAYEGIGTFLACQPPPHYPALSYRWLINEFPNFIKKDDGRWFVSQVSGNLYVAKAEPNDTGNYFCFTTINMDISTKSTFSKANQLTVLPDGFTLVNTLVIEGEFWQVEGGALCTGARLGRHQTVHLPPSQFWDWTMRQNIERGVGGDTVQEEDVDRVEVNGVRLKISNLALEDSGMYQCVAENKHGTIYSTAELRVQVQAPDFRLNPVRKLIPAARGGQVMIECRPRAAPKPSLFWSRGTELLTNGSRVTVTPDGILWIHNISRADEGKYTCFAENYLGKANSTGHLSVRDATKITLAPSNADINQGENVTLQCHASHDPTMDLTFTWALNGVLLDLEDSAGPYHRVEGVSSPLMHDGEPPGTSWRFTDPVNIEGNAESARVMGLMPWMDYEFQVIASNILGSGEPSMPSHTIRTQQAAPTVAPSGLGGGGGDHNELIVTWTPMAREYQNGDGFGYVLAFRKKDTSSWTVVRIPHVESSRYVYYNDSLTPYSPFEVKIKAYNRRGEGPFSQIAVVHSAEEEPTVGPSSINATALTAFEIQVSWEAVQQLSANGILRGYETQMYKHTQTHTGVFPSAPNRRPGNVSWKTDGSWVTVRWDHVKAMHNESVVLGYKVLYKHEGQTALKVLDKAKTSVSLPLPKDNGYVVLEIRSWGEGGDGPAHEIIVSRDSGTGMMVQNDSSSTLSNHPLHLLAGLVLLTLASLSGL
ncbi:contactin-2 [Morone saxatilis]|uniref:contactin-2 n=1 Tax=Morone saxatilis TaxID=34816 RepID=UPI0015E1FA9D|nr:contactin-2 [Morone saxatilis]